MNFFMQRGCARDTRGRAPSSQTQHNPRFSHRRVPAIFARKPIGSYGSSAGESLQMNLNPFAFPPNDCLPKFWILHKYLTTL